MSFAELWRQGILGRLVVAALVGQLIGAVIFGMIALGWPDWLLR